ncbi:UNVERIFIED_CONTAM: hypothetical protein RKD50_000077 [Streptomyces canus]
MTGLVYGRPSAAAAGVVADTMAISTASTHRIRDL